MSWLTILTLLVLAIWWFKPLRDFLVQRTNRVVKVLLVVFPAIFLFRLGYGIYTGTLDEWEIVSVTVIGLLLLWGGLVWLGNFLERRRPTKSRPPDLAMLSKLPGMPRLPAAATSPEAQRAARMAAEAASRVDWDDVAASAGRASGRLFAKLRRSLKESDQPSAQRRTGT
ncbi:MAG: hypothetical protein HY332_20925 [Chloroflexi bacterium]|nr:hypothetical protein [Chloroflexota bacterium]